MLSEEEKSWAAAILSKFPEIRWDRFTLEEGMAKTKEKYSWFLVYGWIARADNKSDFVLFDFYSCGSERNCAYVISSSAAMSIEINERLHSLGYGSKTPGHNACQRVEYTFNIENSIKLEA